MTTLRSKKNPLNNNPIITTKLFVPLLKPNLVRRPRLVEVLNKGLECKLTLISAPAGFGKTTLLSEWINQTNIPVAWFSISKQDNDLMRFITYFVTALQSIEEGIGRTAISILHSTQLGSLEFLLANLINDITTYPKDFIFVFEDYHQIGNKQIHSIVEFLLNHIPLQLHLVIATRSDPFLPLARL